MPRLDLITCMNATPLLVGAALPITVGKINGFEDVLGELWEKSVSAFLSGALEPRLPLNGARITWQLSSMNGRTHLCGGLSGPFEALKHEATDSAENQPEDRRRKKRRNDELVLQFCRCEASVNIRLRGTDDVRYGQ